MALNDILKKSGTSCCSVSTLITNSINCMVWILSFKYKQKSVSGRHITSSDIKKMKKKIISAKNRYKTKICCELYRTWKFCEEAGRGEKHIWVVDYSRVFFKQKSPFLMKFSKILIKTACYACVKVWFDKICTR